MASRFCVCTCVQTLFVCVMYTWCQLKCPDHAVPRHVFSVTSGGSEVGETGSGRRPAFEQWPHVFGVYSTRDYETRAKALEAIRSPGLLLV